MKRIKVNFSAILMLGAMIISDRAEMLLLYFFSAFLHECGHLLAARMLGIGVKEIRFDFSGVRICTEDRLSSYKKEIVLAAAGPLVNFVCVCVSVVFFLVQGVSLDEVVLLTDSFISGEELSYIGAAGFFAIAALLQGGLNLLPVRSFDGGRILQCALAEGFGVRVAERVIDVFSALSALVLWTVALYLLLKIGSGLGIYVFSVCIAFSVTKRTVDEKENTVIPQE